MVDQQKVNKASTQGQQGAGGYPAEVLGRVIREAPGRTLAAKLRHLVMEFARWRLEGVPRREILEALNAHGGLPRRVGWGTLRSSLSRARREVGAKREEPNGTGSAPGPGSSSREAATAPASRSTLGGLTARPTPVITPSELKRLRDEPIDFEALQRLAESNRRKKEEGR